MTTLSKFFTREHTLFYVTMWNESDRLGFEHAGEKLNHSLFLKSGFENTLTIWYNPMDFERLHESMTRELKSGDELLRRLSSLLHDNEKIFTPILLKENKISDSQDLQNYYKAVNEWWSAMMLIYRIAELEDIPEKIRKKTFELRAASEKYSDLFDDIFVDFWQGHYPEFRDITFLVTPEEAFRAQDGFSNAELDQIKKRAKGYILFDGTLYTISELEKILSEHSLKLEENTVSNIMEVIGISAMVGQASGPVRVIRQKSDIINLQSGEVLVAAMTRPEFVQAIKKASAIVTDEGGITCHAAIIARELNIPCVIGTKIATQVLKDGDLVEVDAEKGNVRIIK